MNQSLIFNPPDQSDLAAARILVAEDNPTSLIVVRAMLNKLGYAIDSVSNGREALNALQLTDYDLILMDYQMPDMDGDEVTRRIRHGAEGIKSDVPIVALTGNAEESVQQKCLSAGMNDFLPKPFTLQDLAAMLQRWLPQT